MDDAKGKFFIQNIESRLMAVKCSHSGQLRKFQTDDAPHHSGHPKDKHHDMEIKGNEQAR